MGEKFEEDPVIKTENKRLRIPPMSHSADQTEGKSNVATTSIQINIPWFSLEVRGEHISKFKLRQASHNLVQFSFLGFFYHFSFLCGLFISGLKVLLKLHTLSSVTLQVLA